MLQFYKFTFASKPAKIPNRRESRSIRGSLATRCEISRQTHRSTHDWFIFTHKSLIDENNRFTLNWDKYEAKATAKTQQLDNFHRDFPLRKPRKCFFIFVSHFAWRSSRKETRLECRVECATLAAWSNFIWSRRCWLLQRRNFSLHESGRDGKKFPNYNRIYLPRKSICFIKIGFMDGKGKISFNLNSFSHGNFFCPKTSFEWNIVSA